MAASSGAGEGAGHGGGHGHGGKFMVDAELLLQDKHTAREEEKEAKMAALRKKIRDFQKRQLKLEERKKERNMEMARAYAQKMAEDKMLREEERATMKLEMKLAKERREKQREAEREKERIDRDSGEKKAQHRQSGNANQGAQDSGEDSAGEGGGHGWALTSIDDDGGRSVSPLPSKYRDKIRIPVPSEEQCVTWKIHQPEELGGSPRRPRLPPEACPGRRSKKALQQRLGQKAQKGEKSVVHQLPNMFKGLRSTVEGQAILAQGDPANAAAGGGSRNLPGRDPEEALMPKKTLLRRAQMKLMNQLSEQVSFYRDHMKRNFQRILAATELEFGDVQGRRQQAAWNLAKPLTISEIKQMSAVKIG